MMHELFSSTICDLLVAWRTRERAAKPSDVNEDALGLRILGLTVLLHLWSVCRQSSSSTRQPLPQEMGAQPNVPVDPRGAGYAWTPAPRPPAPPGWLCPVDPNAYLSPWLLDLGLGGPLLWSSRLQVLQCWGFLGNSVSSPLKKKSGKGLAVEKCLALPFPSFQFLAAWGQGTPWTARWGATVQELEN